MPKRSKLPEEADVGVTGGHEPDGMGSGTQTAGEQPKREEDDD